MTYNFKTPHEKATKTTQNNGEVISLINLINTMT